MLWTQVHLFPMSLMLLYHLITVHVLWHAPFYGWLLLISAWARRAAFLWAVLPIIAIAFVEKIAFNTSHFATFLGDRLGRRCGSHDNARKHAHRSRSAHHPRTIPRARRVCGSGWRSPRYVSPQRCSSAGNVARSDWLTAQNRAQHSMRRVLT